MHGSVGLWTQGRNVISPLYTPTIRMLQTPISHHSLPPPPTTPAAFTPDLLFGGMYLPPNGLHRPLGHPIQRAPWDAGSFHRPLPSPPLLRHGLQYPAAVPLALFRAATARVRRSPGPRIPIRLPGSLEYRHRIDAEPLQDFPLARHHDRRPCCVVVVVVVALQAPQKRPLDPRPPRPCLGRLGGLHLCSFPVDDDRLVFVEEQARLFRLDGLEQAFAVESVLFGVEGAALAAVVHDHVRKGEDP